MLEFIKFSQINENTLHEADKNYISLVTNEEFVQICEMLGLNTEHVNEVKNEDGCRFESFDGFDFLTMEILDANDPQGQKPHVCMYLRKNIMILAGDCGEHLSSAVEQIKESKMVDMGIDDILYRLLDVIISDDFYVLEHMEDVIAAVEDRVITDRGKDCIKDVMSIRRDLREMKKFYQQMYMVCEQILENSNGIIKEDTFRYFKLARGRYDRLQNTVISLRDYVTQVREAYQAQVDISQNNIMKFFTVVTSIFMPLTLIVGWYGMNLKMPEYHWEFGYLFVIIISVVIIVALIINFKKRKWF